MGYCEQRGRRCRLDGILREDGWVGCGNHPTRPPELEADPVRELLQRAMRHPQWGDVPGPIRRLIGSAWVETNRRHG